jgi:hypothetical protein
MARGWESKSIEQQQEQAASSPGGKGELLTPQQIAEQQRLHGLKLSRQRTLEQLERVTNLRHKEILERALRDIDAQLNAGK